MRHQLIRVLLGGILALLVGLGAAFFATGVNQRNTDSVNDPRLAGFAAWPALYQALNGDAALPVGLSHIRGLSEVPSQARGSAIINFEKGTIAVSVRGLPVL